MPSPDPSTIPTSTGLPEPSSGVGTADLTTDSTDPDELRALLERARERLAFYESFDRIIGENIRRSGELMVETVQLREQARALADQSAKDRAAFDAVRRAERDRYRALVQTALDEAASVQPIIGAMVGKLQDALRQIDQEPEPSTIPEPLSSAVQETPEHDEEPILTEPDAPELADTDQETALAEPTVLVKEEEKAGPASSEDAIPEESEPTTSRTIQVLALGVPNAKTAIALQKMLRGLGAVTSVNAREFANGELRLAVSTTGPLPEEALTAWLADNAGELTSATETVTEVTFEV